MFRRSGHRSCPGKSSVPCLFIVLSLLVSSAPGAAVDDQAAGQDPIEISRTAALFALGNTEYVLLHELAHALIHDFDIPILGREEDAADTLATLVLLSKHHSSDPDDKRALAMLLVATDAWTVMWQKEREQNADFKFWDRHAISAQRYFNIVCLIYGSDPSEFAEFAKTFRLPPDRAEWCEEEFDYASRASKRLLAPYKVQNDGNQTRATGTIRVIYDNPPTPLSEALRSVIQDSGLLEKTAKHIETGFGLPADMKIRLTSCGAPGAGWDIEEREVVLCYEFIELYYGFGKEAHVEEIRELLHSSSSTPEKSD